MKILGKHTYIIAEAGVNHNGKLDLALRLVDAAKEAGADAVKFQTFHTEDVVSKNAQQASYQERNLKKKQSQYDMVKPYELSQESFKKISQYCRKKKIIFISTPCDERSIKVLLTCQVPFFKIGSAEVTNIPFLVQVAKTKKPIILSTGMSNLDEVSLAVKTIKKAGNKQLVLLHCVSDYPAPLDQLNLKAISVMQDKLNIPVGFSDHTLTDDAAKLSIALGAKVIEKHLTLNKKMKGPDHKASYNPKEFKHYVSQIRLVESMLGDGVKKMATCEQQTRDVVRRSVVAKHDLVKGAKIKRSDLALKRPGTGIAPKDINKVVGLILKKTVIEDEVLTWQKCIK